MTDANVTPSASEGVAPAESGKPTISYDEFAKLDLRVGTVKEVAAHPNADKLLVLQVDLGGRTRQILAGLKRHYAPEALLGRQIVLVANLAPRKMRGLESQGMLLAAVVGGEEKEDVVILTPEKPVPPGSPCS
jgi:methionyl-tRNA synthetase